ncbi:hypothetical protein J8L98_02700 [Pseudoalteromonas sp. MMG013]|uniref:hypothetical protein n=1 Tax=Pseudoalteromonas sp. MMG013 TaxID=2822687 RepID=UPI001B3945A8|nr:hypothetical protein [Pseudoalteromonas sp. MMG013]MBQ4860604.1 hypothetical protein [Pseudoalteromonas sp. MMG013]
MRHICLFFMLFFSSFAFANCQVEGSTKAQVNISDCPSFKGNYSYIDEAIKSAINITDNIYIPAGHFKLKGSEPLILASGKKLYGSGKKQTVITVDENTSKTKDETPTSILDVSVGASLSDLTLRIECSDLQDPDFSHTCILREHIAVQLKSDNNSENRNILLDNIDIFGFKYALKGDSLANANVKVSHSAFNGNTFGVSLSGDGTGTVLFDLFRTRDSIDYGNIYEDVLVGIDIDNIPDIKLYQSASESTEVSVRIKNSKNVYFKNYYAEHVKNIMLDLQNIDFMHLDSSFSQGPVTKPKSGTFLSAKNVDLLKLSGSTGQEYWKTYYSLCNTTVYGMPYHGNGQIVLSDDLKCTMESHIEYLLQPKDATPNKFTYLTQYNRTEQPFLLRKNSKYNVAYTCNSSTGIKVGSIDFKTNNEAKFTSGESELKEKLFSLNSDYPDSKLGIKSNCSGKAAVYLKQISNNGQ